MPKRVILIRHAKSSWDDPRLDDFDRPLNDRGIRNLSGISQRAAALLNRNDAATIVTSPALRTRLTTDAIVYACHKTPYVLMDKALYEASPETIRTVIARAPEHTEQLIVVGHNPGLGELCAQLAPELLGQKFPTGFIASFQCKAPKLTWADALAQLSLETYNTPKMFKP